jgi:hypothetical protein
MLTDHRHDLSLYTDGNATITKVLLCWFWHIRYVIVVYIYKHYGNVDDVYVVQLHSKR